MADIGTATVRVAPNMAGIQGKIARGIRGSAGPATAALGSEVNKSSGPFQSSLKRLGGFAKVGGLAVAAGIGAGVAGIAGLATKMVSARAELEQQLGGSEAVFGKYAKNIQTQAQQAYSKAGLSQQEFLQGANKMGSLFQGAGFNVQQSMKMSGDSMQRASDIASIMGISTTDALEAVTGMAKGNFTMMDNLGVAMNDTAIAAYAASKGINKSTSAMSIQEKVGLAQQMFMEKTAKYAGNYAKENQTLAGSVNTTKKAFDNFMSGGGSIDDFINSLLNSIKIAVPEIVKVLPTIVNGLGSALAALIPALTKVLPKLIPAVIQAVLGLLNAIVKAMPTIVKVLVNALPALITGFIKLFLAILKALPQIILIIAKAMPKIIKALVDGLTNPKALQAMIIGSVKLLIAIIKAIPIIIPALIKALPMILNNLVKTFTSPRFISAIMRAGMQLLKAVVGGVGSILGSVGSAAGRVIGKIAAVLSPGNLARVGGDLVRGLWNGISNLSGWVISKIQGFGSSVLDGIKDFFGIKSPSREFAAVGRDNVRGLAKGFLDNAGLVNKAVNSVADDAFSVMGKPIINPSVAFGGYGGSAAAGSTQNVSSRTTTIERVILGDSSAVKEFFRQINQDVANITMGITPIEGAHKT